MTFAPKKYSHTQLADTKTALVTAGSNNTIHIRSIQLHNTNTSNEDAIIYLNDGTSDLIIHKITIKPNETVLIEYSRGSMILAPTDIISGLTDTASKVTCTVTGEEAIGV